MLTMIAITLTALTLGGSAQAPDLNIALQCDGAGLTDDTTFIQQQDGTAPTIVEGSKRTNERVLIVFEDNTGRIRMPPALQPSIRGRSTDGWRPLTDIAASDDLISTRFSFNFLDKPSVRIDRVTGRVEIRGMAFRFEGDCMPYDAQARRF